MHGQYFNQDRFYFTSDPNLLSKKLCRLSSSTGTFLWNGSLASSTASDLDRGSLRRNRDGRLAGSLCIFPPAYKNLLLTAGCADVTGSKLVSKLSVST